MIKVSIQALREQLSYDPETGIITRLRGRFAGPMKPDVKSVKFNDQFLRPNRVAWALHYGQWPTQLIDHINGNTADNRICNLREATHQQNQYNKAPFGQFSKGVVFKKDANRSKPWAARIRINGKKIPLGSFATETEAAEAYRRAAAKIQGEFALHLSPGE